MKHRQTPPGTDVYGGIGPTDAPQPLISRTMHLPSAAMSRRRLLNLTVFLVIAVVAAGLGYAPWEVPVIVLAWLGGIWGTTRAAERVAADRAIDIATASYSLNAGLLTLACYYLGGATWLAGTFYILLVVVAGASLPRGRAFLVAAVALAGFAFLAIAPVIGMVELPPFGSLTQRTGDLPYTILTVVVQGAALGMVVHLQQWLVGTLRAAVASSRELIEAATDLVAVVDRQGVIHRINPAFTAHTAAHALHGARLADIVTEDYRGYLELKLAQAGDGSRVPFEVSYSASVGSPGWIAGTLVPLPAEESARRILLIARDVTLEHEASAQTVMTLARKAAGLRTRTFARAIGDVMQEMEASLEAVRDRAIALRAQLQLQTDATMANDVAVEAERLREIARDALEWLDATRGRQAG